MRRLSLRTQLTLLYVVPFVVCGGMLVLIPILGVSETQPVGLPQPAHVATPDAHNLNRVIALASIGFVAMVGIALGLGWWIAGRFLRPLRTITATARDISANNLHRRLGLTGGNEFSRLGETLDGLFQRLEASFESQRRFVANASHELRTPLTAERTLLQVALADPDATVDTLRSACEDVLALGAGQERLINALLTLASGERGVERHEPFDLADIAGDVMATRGREAGHRGIHVDAALASAPTTGDASLVESLVANLVDNALRHNTMGGRVEIATATTGEQARITVRNTGPMVPPDELGRLFQPFQQLGRQRVRNTDGHGLGLAIVAAIAGAHDATLVPRARGDGGLDIEVYFPRHPARSSADAMDRRPVTP